MDLMFYVSAIRINTYGLGIKIFYDGSRASHAHYKLRHHVNMQFNKIPTTSYAMQQRDGGRMISQGIGRKSIQTLEPIVLIQILIGEPIKISTTHFFLCTQSFISSRSW